MKKVIKALFVCAVITAVFAGCKSKQVQTPKDRVFETATPAVLERITIVSDTGKNDFITTPVAAHVKTAQQSWGDFSNKHAPDPYYEKCSITVGGETYSGQVKVRGNWTTNYDKKSLRIKFDKKQNLFGLNEGRKFKNWVLLSCYKDASFLRDAAAFTMFRTMFPDYYTSDCKLVELEANGEYFGIYLLVEQQETKEGRINITEAKEDSTNTDIGYLIEFDNYYKNEAPNEQFEIDYIGKIKNYYGETACADITKGYTIKSDIYSKEQHDFIAAYMNNLWRICYNAAYNDQYYRFNDSYELEQYTPSGTTKDQQAKNCVAQVIDLVSLADTYIFNEIVCDPDLYYSSFFMDIDFGQGKDHLLRFEAPWDFDSTMGNKRFCGDCYDNFKGCEAGSMFAGKGQPNVDGSLYWNKSYMNPWMVIFINCPWFQELVKAQWAKINQKELKSEIDTLIASYTGSREFTAAFEATRQKWGIGLKGAIDELNETTKAASQASQTSSAAYLNDWLYDRIDAVDTIIKGL